MKRRLSVTHFCDALTAAITSSVEAGGGHVGPDHLQDLGEESDWDDYGSQGGGPATPPRDELFRHPITVAWKRRINYMIADIQNRFRIDILSHLQGEDLANFEASITMTHGNFNYAEHPTVDAAYDIHTIVTNRVDFVIKKLSEICPQSREYLNKHFEVPWKKLLDEEKPCWLHMAARWQARFRKMEEDLVRLFHSEGALFRALSLTNAQDIEDFEHLLRGYDAQSEEEIFFQSAITDVELLTSNFQRIVQKMVNRLSMLEDGDINAIYVRKKYTEPFRDALSNSLEWQTDIGGPPVELPMRTLSGSRRLIPSHLGVYVSE